MSNIEEDKLSTIKTENAESVISELPVQSPISPEDTSEYVVVEKTLSTEEIDKKSSPTSELPTTVEELQALVISLQAEIKSLKEEISTLKKPASRPAIKASTLAPLTKGRVMKPGATPRPKSTPTDSTPSKSPDQETQPTESEKPQTPEPEPEEDPEARKKRIIAQMGGINPLAGLHAPVALNAATLLKSRSALGSGHGDDSSVVSSGRVSETVHVDEGEIRGWISKTIGEDVGDLKTSLRDGTVLCKLINALRPDNPVKVNTGRFSFMHMENINNFIKASSQMGVAKHTTFTATDLYDGTDMGKVLQCLAGLQKSTAK
ncbi:hypothetical protein HK098_008051 [Nowakowskiella sp. JEL0407]|nr:hypothetical protein HK098_008051 [Nowakowskiella sp. JEL0407]